MSTIVYLLLLPVTMLNLFGGIAGFVWLAILGQWMLIGIGLIALFISTLWLGIALAPGLLFGGPGLALAAKRRYISGGLLILIGEAWTYVVMYFWCSAVFIIGINAWGTTPSLSIYPFLLWIYGTATGPFTYFAATSQGSPASFVGALAACVGMAFVLGLVLLKMATPEAMMIALVVPMVVALIVQAIMYVIMANAGAFEN